MSRSSSFVIMVMIVAIGISASGCGDSSPPEKQNRIPEQAESILLNAESFELFALAPMLVRENMQLAPESLYRGRLIIGRTMVDDPATRRALVTALQTGVKEYDGLLAACFIPRHGIRVKRGSDVADFVICFQCLEAYACVNDEQRAGTFHLSGSPQAEFNRVLKAAGIEPAN